VRTDPYGGEQVVNGHAALLTQRVSAIMDSQSEGFVELVHDAGLDPASDLRFGDWRGLDLSGADLRGFDFTGADLTGARFDNARIAGANFECATVKRSSLRRAVDFDEYVAAKPGIKLARASNDEIAVQLYLVADQNTPLAPGKGDAEPRETSVNRKHAELLEAVAADSDRHAFGQLHDHFSPRIRSFLARSGLEPSAAEDLTQEVMTKLWLRAHQFDRTKSSVATWLFRIARNARIDHFRRQRGEPPAAEAAMLVPDAGRAPDDALNASQWEELVQAALSKLPPKQLAIVRLAFFDGLSHAEIAVRTGLPLGTVKARIRSALTRLRRRL
jgi:RNA polymerase sigma factor (sigma-70 family)